MKIHIHTQPSLTAGLVEVVGHVDCKQCLFCYEKDAESIKEQLYENIIARMRLEVARYDQLKEKEQ